MSAWADIAGATSAAVRDTFGVDVVYTPASTGVPESIVAPFDNAFERIEIAGGQPFASTGPVIDIVLADLSVPPAQGDTATVEGQAYEVVSVEPNGQGDAKLHLVEVPS